VADSSPSQRKVVVLVVHGVGEQVRFEQVEAIAANLYQALKDAGRNPVIEIHRGDQVPRGSPEHSVLEEAVTVRWDGEEQPRRRRIEVRFREVHWADLDEPMNFAGWWRFVGWAASMSGVRFFERARVGAPQAHGMCPPLKLPWWKQVGVRLKLFLLSLVFLILLGTIGLLDVILKRFSITIKVLERGYRLFFDYLGDIKLYQDWYLRHDCRVEVVGSKSRIAIRRRMVRELLQTASSVLQDESIEGFYIFAHSLGTVIAFNALMETEVALPNYLTQSEWDALDARLKKSVAACPTYQEPRRRPWLDPYRGGYAAIDRDVLHEKFLGLLTAGSPLDRFAALWPAIVPVNAQAPRKPVEWINVHDVQDIVAGGAIRLYPPCTPGGQTIGGLTKPNDIDWADQFWFFRAHTFYWSAQKGRRRLIDSIYRWLEGGRFEIDPGSKPRALLRRIVYALSLITVSVLLLWAFAALVRLFIKALRPLFDKYDSLHGLRDWLIEQRILGHYADTIVPTMWKTALVGMALIGICSLVRHAWERHKFDSE